MSDLEKQDLASGAEVGMRMSGRKNNTGKAWPRLVSLSWKTLPGSQSQFSADSNPEITCAEGKAQLLQQVSLEGGCGLAPKLREDAGEKVDVDHEENEDVGRGCGCRTGCRPEKDDHREGCGPWA